MKGTSARQLKNKTLDELNGELKKFKEELQTIRFSKVSGTAVAKLSKIKALRRSIARALTLINVSKRNEVIANLRVKTTVTKGEDGKDQTTSRTVKNLKSKHIPFDLRYKKTRAIRRRLTKHESKLVTLPVLKRRLNFPKRRFAVPL